MLVAGFTMITMTARLLVMLSLQDPQATGISTDDAAPSKATKLPSSDPPPEANGFGMIATGGLLTVGGGALMVASGFSFAAQARCERSLRDECWAGLGGAIALPVGLVAVAGGVPLFALGARRYRIWRKWQADHALTLRPHFDRGRGSWALGVALRF